jgi:hypothetical protein
MNGTTKYTNWGVTPTNKPEPAYNPAAVPPPLCLQSNYSEAQNGAGGFANWPCTFKFPYICKTMGMRQGKPLPCQVPALPPSSTAWRLQMAFMEKTIAAF